jgi:hypothetical protein
MNVLRVLIKKLKEVTFYKKNCNYHINTNSNLYFFYMLIAIVLFHTLMACLVQMN